MGEGSHRAKLVVDGDAKGATKEMDALAKKVAELEKKIEQVNNKLDKKKKKLTDTEEQAKKFRDSIGKLNTVIGAGGLVAAATLAFHALDKLSTRAVEASNVSRNLKVSIDGAAHATKGFVSTLELQKAAAQALGTGAIKTSADFTRLTTVAAKLATKLGTDTTTAVADLSLALSRQSPMILDNLGITLKLGEAQQRYADSIGKSVSELTDAEKAEAFRTEAMKAAEKATEGVTIKTKGYAAAVQQLKAVWDNVYTSIAQIPENLADLDQELNWAFQNRLLELGLISEKTWETWRDDIGGAKDANEDFFYHMQRGAPALNDYLAKINDMSQGERELAESIKKANAELGKQSGDAVFGSSVAFEQAAQAAMAKARGQQYGDTGIEAAVKQKQQEEERRRREAIAAGKRHAAEEKKLLEEAYRFEKEIWEKRQDLRQRDWEFFNRVLEQKRAAERAAVEENRSLVQNDLQLSITNAQRQLEVAQIMGIGVVEATEAEIAARERLIAVKLRAAQQDQDFEEIKALQDQQSELRHERHILRVRTEVEAEQKALEKRKAFAKQTIQVSTQVASNFGGSLLSMQFAANDAAAAARAAGEDEAKAVKRTKGEALVSVGRELLGRSIAMAAMAVGDFASFNYVGGALKLGAAAAMASTGGIVIGRGRSMISEAGGGGGGYSGGGASSAISAANAGASPSSAANQAPTTNARGIPTSPSPAQTQASSVPRSGTAASQSSGPQFNGPVTFQVTGALDRDTMLKIDKGLVDLNRDRPKRSA